MNNSPRRLLRSVAVMAYTLLVLLLVSIPSFASEGEADLGGTLPLWSALPFALLLLAIAVVPLVRGHWWESNVHKGIVAGVLSLPVALFFLIHDASHLLHTGLEYASFIILLGSLFVISGGIVLKGDLKATPLVNCLFLGIGAVIANVVGTTGASMLLIRPLLRTNSERKFTKHIPLFFIFLVSNIGGALTPIGDPPLFLGYLRGVPFAWTLQLWPIWLLAVGIVLFIFYLFERAAIKKESPADLALDKSNVEPLRISGSVSFLFLGGVVAAVIGAGYMEQHGMNPTPWRELAMIVMAGVAYVITPRARREENKFTFGPIIEVAVLFAGIFVTMVPALLILRARGGEMGVDQPWQFFWMTGGLSSFLDNAPTYLTYLSLSQGVTENLRAAGSMAAAIPIQGGEVLEVFLKAISVGAVFMGANSYIGNGPNFMVKSIAEETGVKMPSFFGYMLYSMLILIPVFIVITFIFFNPFGTPM